jgi:hypothetical protein
MTIHNRCCNKDVGREQESEAAVEKNIFIREEKDYAS